ncbi:hypothetical protein JAAARDRAFT_41042 [Jaapia argillacea MUCL 33604]|uniref:N-acetyltransferase domain-containing protein n=1 Tax=Jaapia argillacea MUCL 33604 TaxID=933084 RepID=A0A067PMN0_9AGAM|nr:hypothetical protein JAAARDRAFT_41042 [Jaapia argillacea MUCL 33604]
MGCPDNPNPLEIRPTGADDTIPLRHSVLWPNAPISYVRLPEDDNGHHFGAFLPHHDTPTAVISLFTDPLPITDPGRLPVAARFRKFACDPPHQGKGIGTSLLNHVFLVARSTLGAEVIWCDARVESASWYQARGMTPFGERFWKGTIEYIRMKIHV